jgi:uncharacterized protein (DUF302 family)
MSEAVVVTSRHTYSETIALLTRAITAAGSTLFANIDQSAAAAAAGLTLRPTTLLLFGNPKGGTPLMDEFPLVALDLPLKVLVWDEDGTAKVAYVKASEIAARFGVAGRDALISSLDRALETLVSTIA